MLTRKVFLTQLGGGLTMLLSGCGGGGGDTPAPAAPAPAPAAASCGAFAFSANHGHVLIIPEADLDSTVARSYNIQGSAPHNHTVTLTPAQLAALKAGQMIALTTSTDATHAHDMSGGCR